MDRDFAIALLWGQLLWAGAGGWAVGLCAFLPLPAPMFISSPPCLCRQPHLHLPCLCVSAFWFLSTLPTYLPPPLSSLPLWYSLYISLLYLLACLAETLCSSVCGFSHLWAFPKQHYQQNTVYMNSTIFVRV